jgi:hypothetical protein
VADFGLNNREKIKAVFGRTPDCLPADAIAAFAASDITADPAARTHVSGCAFCQNEIALAREFESATPRGDETAAVAWIESELRRRSSPIGGEDPATLHPGLWPRVREWLVSGSSGMRWRPAALVLASASIAIIGTVYLRNDVRRPLADPGARIIFRSGLIRTVAPAEEVVEAPSEFRWETVVGAARYQVRLLAVDRQEIWSAEVSTPSIAIPSEIRRQMSPGRSFLWQVVAKNSTGAGVAQSNLQFFHVAITRR